jgi:RNA polymerase sigma-70 factor (ECF subfamily)
MDEDRSARDRRLAERIAGGDSEAPGAALEELYDAYAGAVYRQALSLLGSRADAEDVVQEVFLKLVRRRGGPIWEPKAYLLTAARHEACSSLRRRRREAPTDDIEVGLAGLPVPFDSRNHAVEVREALAALPVEQREVVVLKVYEQRTFEEIGQMLKTSINTVASRYRYALKKLRQALGDSAHG